MVTRVQNLNKAAFISYSTNTFGKGMNPIISLQLWVKVGQTGFFNLGEDTSLGEGKL